MSICVKHVLPRSPKIVFPRLSSFETKSIKYGTPVKKNIFNGGIILTTYNTRSIGYTVASTWATYLSTHNRTIPLRKANFAIASSSGGGLQIN